MVDATNGVGPLGNQQFSTKGVKLSDLKKKISCCLIILNKQDLMKIHMFIQQILKN